MNLCEVEDLSTHIRMRRSTVEPVDKVTFTIKAGETVGLVGESGCGKSMTAMSIMRLLPPGGRIVGGSVTLNGRDLQQLSAADMRKVRGDEVAMVFQDPMTSLNPTMTVGDQISEAVRLHREVSRREATDRAAEMLELVGMPQPRERLGFYPHQLSGGMRQRVVIAMALACEPKLLIADEPTTALDVTIQAQILELLDDLKEQLHMGMLLITHDLGVIAGRADRVMVMYAGRIVETGTTGEVFRSMRHPYTQALLASVPELDTDRGDVLYSIGGAPPDLSDLPPGCRFAPRCQYAQERCHAEDPSLVGEPDRQYACFFPVDGPLTDAVAATDGVTDAALEPADIPRVIASPAGAEIAVVRSPSEPASRGTAGHVSAENGRAALVSVKNVVKEFPIRRGVLQRQVAAVHAVSDVTFEVAKGEAFGLVGESGCGKTTLGRMIVGLETVSSGRILVGDEEVSQLRGSELRRKRRDLQLIFQDPHSSLDPRMRVGSILREPLAAQGIGTRKQQTARVRELLEEVGLSPRSSELYPHEFSGGQRQRIGFARALALQPRVIVADEPVSALDVSVQSQMLNLMRDLQRERDLTYVVISHDLAVVRYLADRIGVMYLGKLVEVGSADDVYKQPAHPYTAALLASIPDPDPAKARRKRKGVVTGELPSAAAPPSGCRFRTRCPRAQDKCATEEPPLRAFNADGHLGACHFPLQTPLASGSQL
jgi:peptide/nickel transport system ATP-binding protein